MNKETLKAILVDHKEWLQDSTKGKKADLRGADLRGADLREADLRGADLRGADLREADLREADLREADLRGADLWNCTGNNREVRTVQAGAYTINIISDVVQIGCENHTWAQWQAFTDEQINNMDHEALEWWRTWKPTLTQIINATEGN